MSIFHPPKVVGRDSQTQLQVSENLNFNVALYGLLGRTNCISNIIVNKKNLLIEIIISELNASQNLHLFIRSEAQRAQDVRLMMGRVGSASTRRAFSVTHTRMPAAVQC